jgi:hypothetical protein
LCADIGFEPAFSAAALLSIMSIGLAVIGMAPWQRFIRKGAILSAFKLAGAFEPSEWVEYLCDLNSSLSLETG